MVKLRKLLVVNLVPSILGCGLVLLLVDAVAKYLTQWQLTTISIIFSWLLLMALRRLSN